MWEGTSDFPRLRIGVGRPPPRWDTADYVLGKFGDDDRPFVDEAIKKAADAVETWVSSGVQVAMNKFNADAKKANKPKKPRPVVDNQSDADLDSESKTTQDTDI